MSILIFLVITQFTPAVSIFLFSGVFITQTILNVFDHNACCNFKTSKQHIAPPEDPENRSNKCSVCSGTSFSVASKLLAFLLQVVGVFGVVGYYVYDTVVFGAPIEYRVVVGLPLAIFVLSVVWSNRCQEFIARSSNSLMSARYKSSKLLARIMTTSIRTCGRKRTLV